MGSLLEQVIGALTGAVGDRLARSGNGLAITMTLVHRGRPLGPDPASPRADYGGAGGRVVVLAHGLMCSEDLPSRHGIAVRGAPGAGVGARVDARAVHLDVYR